MANEGLDCFSFEIIEEVDNSLLNEREQFWIKKYQSLAPIGYNISEGGAGTSGYSRPQSIKEREKRKLSNIEFYIKHPEARQNMSERTKRLWEDEEYRKKVTESNRRFYQEHPGIFSGKNNPMYGKHHTEKALEKIRANAAKKKKQIAKLDKDTLEVIKIYDGVKDAEKDIKASHGWLSKAARSDKIAYGYRWRFI